MPYAVVDHYYSGQGVALLARRTPDKIISGFRPVGNVPDLKISVKTSVLEHKESTTGQRAKDLRMTTDVSCDLSMTMENFISENLADVLRGVATAMVGATATDEPCLGWPGAITGLAHIKMSVFSLKQNGVSLTAYVDADTPYDYMPNLDGGSFMLNDGASVDLVKLGEVVTAVTVGTTTTLTVDNNAVVGDKVTCRGFTGADAAFLNDKTFVVTEADSTSMKIAAVTTAKTITAGATTFILWPGMELAATYTYANQFEVDAMTLGAQEYALRFEGLNTAEANEPVVIEVFRISADILKDLELISDKVQAFELAGSVLLDNTRVTGSKFFKTTKLN